jgi:alpha-1,3-rhamnosyl/mannosyltransferase
MIELPPSVHLAIAGRAGSEAPTILGQIEQLGLTSRVVRLGYLPEDVLSSLMATADALVYPSRYEGFGLPVIEALATGAPVVATDLPVFHEVGGDVVDYFEVADPSSLANAIEGALSKAENGDVRSQRIRRARQFDWRASAEIVARRLKEFD